MDNSRIYSIGTIFLFNRWPDDLFILAQVDANLFNLISLRDGNRKTSSWECNGGIERVLIPERTWFAGGPPMVVSEGKPLRNIKETKDILGRDISCNDINKKAIKLLARID